MQKNKILFVYEGLRPEESIMKSIEKHIIKNFGNEIIVEIFENNIYELYAKIEDDPYLELIELLKEKSKNLEFINTPNRYFSQIYLFFDYDGHDCKANDDTIKQMLAKFDNETEFGKLFISYPMSEAIKHFDDNLGYCKCCTVKINKFKAYKNLVSSASYKNNLNEYDFDDWIKILQKTIMKIECIYNERDCTGVNYNTIGYDVVEKITEIEIFNLQLRKITASNEVYILSGYPFFILRYYGEKFYNKFVLNK